MRMCFAQSSPAFFTFVQVSGMWAMSFVTASLNCRKSSTVMSWNITAAFFTDSTMSLSICHHCASASAVARRVSLGALLRSVFRWYRRTCLGRPLVWTTTRLGRPQSPARIVSNNKVPGVSDHLPDATSDRVVWFNQR